MKRFFTIVLACFLVCTALIKAAAQPYYFRHYQTENGLSFNSVFACTQDANGFMWFGTRDGLNRFDGYTFKVFRHDPDVAGSIGNNFIYDIFVDAKGIMWVGTQNGFYRYNPQTESFQTIKQSLGHGVRSIRMDKNGELWFVWGPMLARYNPAKDAFRSYPQKRYFQANSVTITREGLIWIGTNDGLIEKYDPQNDDFIPFSVFAHSPQTVSKRIECIYDTGEQSLLAGTSNQGIKLFDMRTGTYKDAITLSSNKTEIYARAFLKSGPDEFWCATESGIYIYNIRTSQFNNLRKTDNDPYSLSDNAVYSLCADNEGGIYAGTYFGGVNYYPRQYSNFQKFFHTYGRPSISGSIVREICQDKYANIWIGTEDAGLNKYNPATGDFVNFYPTGNRGSIAYTNIHGLLAVGDELWIGTYQHGLDVMDIKTGQVKRHYDAGMAKGKLHSGFIVTIHQTRNGNILIGTSQGLYRYLPAADEFELMPYPGSDHFISSIWEDHTGTIWLTSLTAGFFYYKPGTTLHGEQKLMQNGKSLLASSMLTSVFEDDKNNLWIATENAGLFCLFPDRQHFKVYNTHNGMPSNFVFRALQDKAGNMWVSTTKGLACLQPATGHIRTYKKSNGLLNDQFNYSSAFKDDAGNMYFGSIKGLIKFNPDLFNSNRTQAPVFITGLQVDNKELAVAQEGSALEQSITYTRQLALKHNQNTLSIDFAALSFTAPEMTAYRYKMQGLDKNWTYLKSNRKVYYTQIPPGSYTFKVEADNGSNHWGNSAADLQISIRPPFWASYWAYAFYLLVAGTIAYYLLRFYHKYLAEENRRKMDFFENEKNKEIYEAKIEFFTNIAHEIRTPLTLIKAPLEIVKSSDNMDEIRENAYVMDKNADRLLNLTNQLLDFRKTEIKGFSLNFIKTNIGVLLRDIGQQFKPVVDLRQLKFSIETPADAVHAFVDPEALYKILSNLINNAVKYADKEVKISLTKDNAKPAIVVTVQNDGPIIPPEMQEKIFEPFFRMDDHTQQTGTGIGLALARSLAQLHNGTLELLAANNQLNTFRLLLPEHQSIEFQFESKETESSAQETAATPGEKPVIMIAEDNKDIMQFMQQNLGTLYHVIPAANGQIALNKLAENPVQLVITDLMMPIMDGYELCKNIKTNFDYSHVPVIMLTAKNTLQSKIEGLGSGADAYIEKPFSPEHLHAQIASLIENRAKVKAYFAKSPLIHIKTIAYSKADEAFLEKLNHLIIQNIADLELDAEHLAELLFMSRPTLFRKIKAIANMTPNELITLTRLKKAAELLTEDNYKIYEVADMTGFSSPTVFARIFHKQFNLSPSEYAASQRAAKTV